MTEKYLEKIEQDLLERKIDLDKQKIQLDNAMKENTQFIQLLDESNDPNYEAFTPRTVNVRNKEKISELKEEQKTILVKINQLEIDLDDTLQRLNECRAIIKYEKDKANCVATEEKYDASYKLKLLEAQENERQRIARELHDSTVQDLTSMLHKIELSTKVMEVDPKRCKMELSNVSENIRNVINNTREMIYNLRPMSLDDIGIDVTLERAIAKIEKDRNRNIEYIVIGEPFHVKSVVALSLLRIMQEACSNAVKYANAEEICVVLEYTENDISMVVEDNGIGFDTNKIIQTDRNTGFGLSMMKERVNLLSGTINIESKIGTGTTISIRVPNFKEEQIDE